MAENPPTILWAKFIFNGEQLEVNVADGDVKKILWTGPGMIEVIREQGIVESIVASEMWCRTKVDQIKVPNKEIVMPS